ncbi:NTF2-like protein [Pyrenochaeta sp. DS3sAY3a]|nr:NTF2-like protein [Pyrenochaeta sp. DS3sAY3a]
MGGAPVTPPSASAPLSYPAPQQVSPHVTLQRPLSRRGRGPGLILVLDHYASTAKSEKHLDPEPLQKWAEEGFAVVELLVPGNAEDGGEFPLQKALDLLKGCEECDMSNGVGMISYISRLPYYVEEAASQCPDIKALISYGGRKFTTLSSSISSLPPQLVLVAGPETPRRESFSVVPGTGGLGPVPGVVKSHRYEDAKRDTNWVLPSDDDYHKRSAGIAHTRSLEFLKPLLKGPYFELEAIWEEHCKFEFAERDVESTMATMVDEPYVNHIPTMTGGIGKARLTSFYTHHFIFSNPPDTSLSLISRTVGIDRVIDEFVFAFTHTTHIPWLLPGIPPTGRRLELAFTSVVALRGDRLCHEHIAWDQASALHQLGLLPEWVDFPYQVEGTEGRVQVRLPVVGVEASRKLADEGCVESNELMGETWRVVQ